MRIKLGAQFAYVVIVSSLAATFLSCSDNKTPEGDFDLLITNVKIIDGSGSPSYGTDLLVRGDTIAFIGKVNQSNVNAAEVIVGNGRILSPGFIDAHAHGDPLVTPNFENFLSMGVTTICLGQDGFSHESENLLEWINQIDSTGVGVNVLTFIGHSTIRSLSGTGYSEFPSADQLSKMKVLLEQGMKQGAFGLSTGLEYTPGYYAKPIEMAELAKVVGENHGLIMSHMRNEDDDQIESSINELLEQGIHAPVHISHFKVVYGRDAHRASQLLAILDSARKTGIRITSDVYPYTASYTGIGILFPEWAKAPNDYKKVVANRRNELKNYLHEKVMRRNGPEATLLGNGKWRGMTLRQVADSLKISFEDVLIDIIGPEGASGAYFVMNEELQSVLIKDSLVCVSSDGSPTMHHPRGYGSFAKIIRYYVNETGELSLPEAIRKMTSLPASIIGIQKRGLVKVGYKADLLIFDPLKVQDLASFEDPHRLAEGFDFVIINGMLAKTSDKIANPMYGQFLRKQF